MSELTDSDLSDALAALQDTFDPRFDRSWFDWKHRSGPWGPSRGWVARDSEGLIGVRLFLPWQFQDGEQEYDALRPCDTVTVPRARGRGVFRKMTEHAISQVRETTDFLFNTPNEQSKPGYMKMGFVDWTMVGNRIGGVIPNRARMTDSVTLITAKPGLATLRTQDFLDWRYSRCPVNDYRISALAESEGPNGIVARSRTWRGMRMMIVEECWGGKLQERALVRAAANELGARLVWIAETMRHVSTFSFARSSTAVTRFDLRRGIDREPSLSLGDVESVL